MVGTFLVDFSGLCSHSRAGNSSILPVLKAALRVACPAPAPCVVGQVSPQTAQDDPMFIKPCEHTETKTSWVHTGVSSFAGARDCKVSPAKLRISAAFEVPTRRLLCFWNREKIVIVLCFLF